MTAPPDPLPFLPPILSAYPDLAAARFTVISGGWDSVAVDADADDRLIFKFPRTLHAEQSLRTEAALLSLIRPTLSIPVPAMTLQPGRPLFSAHPKLPGNQLLSDDYAALPAPARARLAFDLARFHAELHALPMQRMTAAGAGPIKPWLPTAEIRARAVPLLPEAVAETATRALAAYEALPPDPYGQTYGHFDCHGWNMAFDLKAGVLNGIYDFADSGIGPLHQDFIYSSFIAADLTSRIVATYESLTGKALNRNRIALLTFVLRLSELADAPDAAPHVLSSITESAAHWPG